jgi:esterase
VKLFYRSYGSGKPLLILHGLFGMGDNWTTLAKHFGEKGFTAYTVDLRNHGQSPHSDEFSYELMTEDVLELIDDLKLTSASVIGHSMGAKVAMLLALHHPSKIEKLVAVDIAPRYYPPHHQYIFDAIRSVGDLSAYASRKDVETQNFVSLLPNESTRQFILKNLYWKKTEGKDELAWRFNVPVIEKNIEDMGITLNTSSSFGKPTLFIKGEKSSYITANDEIEIRNLFPQVIFKTIAGAGHWVHADKPMEFLETVMAFLN